MIPENLQNKLNCKKCKKEIKNGLNLIVCNYCIRNSLAISKNQEALVKNFSAIPRYHAICEKLVQEQCSMCFKKLQKNFHQLAPKFIEYKFKEANKTIQNMQKCFLCMQLIYLNEEDLKGESNPYEFYLIKPFRKHMHPLCVLKILYAVTDEKFFLNNDQLQGLDNMSFLLVYINTEFLKKILIQDFKSQHLINATQREKKSNLIKHGLNCCQASMLPTDWLEIILRQTGGRIFLNPLNYKDIYEPYDKEIQFDLKRINTQLPQLQEKQKKELILYQKAISQKVKSQIKKRLDGFVNSLMVIKNQKIKVDLQVQTFNQQKELGVHPPWCPECLLPIGVKMLQHFPKELIDQKRKESQEVYKNYRSQLFRF